MIKQLFHKAVQSFGYDIVSVDNLEEEVSRRIKNREAFHISETLKLRERQRQASAGAIRRRGLIWVNRSELISTASEAMLEASTLLDIGCAFRPQKILVPKIHICCEPFHEYMDRLIAETAGDSHFVYLQLNIEQTCDAFPDRSVDTAFLGDVIEHIDRDISARCLTKLKSIVRRQIILFTPIGFMPQDPSEGNADIDQWGMHGVEWQKHRSGWTPDDFPESDGWLVIACRDFHQDDGYGRALEEPFGAMWAIWSP
jgi:hypothetical protein